MIINKDTIDAIKRKELRVINLGFETTRRCNLACAHCYKGDAQPVDIDPQVPMKVFEYFNYFDIIHLYGGESQLNPAGLQHINNAIKEHKVKFNELSFVTNGTIINKEFFEILKETQSLSRHKKSPVISISNTHFHDEAIKNIGLTRKDITTNCRKLRNSYPDFLFIERSAYTQEETGYYVKNVGRAKDFKNTIQRMHKTEMDISEFSDKRFLFSQFNTDAKGNVIERMQEYETGDTKKFGNVLTTPMEEILIEHCTSRCY